MNILYDACSEQIALIDFEGSQLHDRNRSGRPPKRARHNKQADGHQHSYSSQFSHNRTARGPRRLLAVNARLPELGKASGWAPFDPFAADVWQLGDTLLYVSSSTVHARTSIP